MDASRVQKIYQIAAHAGLDAIVLIPGANLRYLTGLDFHLMERPLVTFFVPGQSPVAVVPALEQDRLAESGLSFKMFPWTDSEGYAGAFQAAAEELHLAGQRIGVEELRMRVLEEDILRRYFPGAELILAGKAISALRLRKDSADLDQMRAAIALSEDALRATLAAVSPGMTEREITGTLVVEQLKRGGGPHPFEPIVLSGPNSALPHGEPGSRTVAEGEVLLIDYGTTVGGYASDITRTFVVGEPSARLREVYGVVQAANAAGRAAVRPGISAQEIDRITRKVIADAGFGEYFTHRTGHGLGLETHEHPNIVEGNETLLEAGMVFTIEPGIYLPGEFGVRIEDNVVVTEDGGESLTTFPRDLQSVGQQTG